MMLVAVLIAGVVLASFRDQENLTLGMVTRDKRAPGPDDVD
jgi:cytochrome b